MVKLMETAIKILKFEEGFRAKPYYCSEGYPTIGYGQKLGGKGDKLPAMETTKEEAEVWMLIKVKSLYADIADLLKGLDEPRQAVLVSMAYQLGEVGLRAFRKTLAAIKARDWETARLEMMNSKWHRQTPKRATRHEHVMRTGLLPK